MKQTKYYANCFVNNYFKLPVHLEGTNKKTLKGIIKNVAAGVRRINNTAFWEVWDNNGRIVLCGGIDKYGRSFNDRTDIGRKTGYID